MNKLEKTAYILLQIKPNMKSKELAKKMNITDKQAKKLIKVFLSDQTNKTKSINQNKNRDKSKNLILKGRIEGHKEGYAFFIPDNGTEDYFIHSKNLNSAIHGDLVEVKTGTYKGRKEAVVINIIKRSLDKVIGIASIIRGNLRVTPFSKNFTSYILISKDEKKYKDGDILICQIDKYPTRNKSAEGYILKYVGHISDIGIDNNIVMYKYNLDKNFSTNILNELDNINVKKDIYNKGLVNLTNLFTVTIDGEDAKDFDDAISIGIESGRSVLYVHISDVSRFVLKGSLVDIEAERRGTSVYFPQYAIPMLPEKLSNGECSLIPNENRYTITAKITFAQDGTRLWAEFYPSEINSNYRLTYSYVNEVLSGDTKAYSSELRDFLKELESLAKTLDKRKELIGGLTLDLPESKFVFDDKENIKDIYPIKRGFAEKMIEHFMVSANEAVAEFLELKCVPTLYRTHGDPDISKLESWIEATKLFGLNISEIPSEITPEVIKLYSDIASNSKHPELLTSMLVRCMMRAEYTTENIGHFGLASKAYTHFTSPIRRYPDLVVHRSLLYALGFRDCYNDIEYLNNLAKKCSALGRNAEEAEGEISVFKKLEYLNYNSDNVYIAYINRINVAGLFIYLEKIMLVGFISFENITYDKFYVEDGIAYSKNHNKRFKIGDKISVKLHYINIPLLQAEFILDDVFPSRQNKTKQKRKKTIK